MMKLLKILILFSVIACAYSDCIYSLDIEKKPIFIKKFGSRRVLMPKNMDTVLRLKTDETIEAFCVNGFRHGCNRDIRKSNIVLKCSSNEYIYYASDGINFNDALQFDCNSILKCTDSFSFPLYESKLNLSNCEPGMSLGVGIKVLNNNPVIFAGICYDWTNMDLKYVNYLAYRSKSGFLTHSNAENIQQINSVTLDEELGDIQDYFKLLSHNNSILQQFNFENDSLVQDLPLKDELTSIENLLQIIWWRNLRLANWRTFLELLQERSRNVPYNIFTGTSGVITMPALDSECKENKTFAYTNSNKERKAVPAYIWSYLKSQHTNITEEFVVIAYNSPFYYNDPSIYLCEDICDQIEWFHSFHKLRKMATLGLIYCCRPEDVAHTLQSFPHLVVESEISTTKQPPEENWTKRIQFSWIDGDGDGEDEDEDTLYK